jgi:hypothetical protein
MGIHHGSREQQMTCSTVQAYLLSAMKLLSSTESSNPKADSCN